MFVKGMCLSVIYCLSYAIDIFTDMSEEQVSEEIDLDLNEEKDTRMDNSREENWMDVADEGDDKRKINYLRW